MLYRDFITPDVHPRLIQSHPGDTPGWLEMHDAELFIQRQFVAAGANVPSGCAATSTPLTVMFSLP